MELRRKYLNLITGFDEQLKQAIQQGKWVKINREIIEPLKFINHFGRSWMLDDGSLELVSPDKVIEEAEAMDLTEEQRQRLDVFKRRVRIYKDMRVDALLLEAIETNIYPDELDDKF